MQICPREISARDGLLKIGLQMEGGEIADAVVQRLDDDDALIELSERAKSQIVALLAFEKWCWAPRNFTDLEQAAVNSIHKEVSVRAFMQVGHHGENSFMQRTDVSEERQRALVATVRKSRHISAQLEAVSEIKDIDVFPQLALQVSEPSVAIAVANRMKSEAKKSEIIASLTKNSANSKVGVAAVWQMRDLELLKGIAIKHKFASVSVAAVERLIEVDADVFDTLRQIAPRVHSPQARRRASAYCDEVSARIEQEKREEREKREEQKRLELEALQSMRDFPRQCPECGGLGSLHGGFLSDGRRYRLPCKACGGIGRVR